MVIIGLAVIELWVWQGDRIVQFVSDNSTTADDRGQKQKIEVPLVIDRLEQLATGEQSSSSP